MIFLVLIKIIAIAQALPLASIILNQISMYFALAAEQSKFCISLLFPWKKGSLSKCVLPVRGGTVFRFTLSPPPLKQVVLRLVLLVDVRTTDNDNNDESR